MPRKYIHPKLKKITGETQSVGELKDGKVVGKAIVFYRNGYKQLESNFKNGKPDGLTTRWRER